MEVYFSRIAKTTLKAVFAGALSGLVCFGQSTPRPSTPKGSAAQKPTATASASSPQKVVLTVGNVKVTRAEMDFLIQNLNPQLREAVAAHGRGALGQEYSLMILLSQKAVSDHLDASPDLRREIALQTHQTLAQAEYRDLASHISVNPEEISTFYTAHKEDFEEASIREFVVRKKAADAKADDPGLSPEAAKARLDSIRKAIVAGTAITQVAKQFDVPNAVMVEPEPRTIHRGQLLPALDKQAFELSANQFSEPVDTPNALVAIQVVSHQQPELKDVSAEIEKTLRQQKVQAALDDLKAKANIWMDPAYFKSPAASEASTPVHP
ncbi:MAG TPA: peptidyl-prolyl cis-trans isomerase [Terriglobia bacterium]|nr:peptidyl-prolyl cis-trans isomerase [Terriglobia bacterium]